jgi:hypothetical protein
MARVETARLLRAAALVLLLATAAGAAPPIAAIPTIEHARRPDAVVVVYREVLGEIGGDDRGPSLTIFGDGRMVAHYPLYMKRAGDYEARLAPGELDTLLASLAAKGVLDFDAPATRAATRASTIAAREHARATNAPITLFEAVDASTTVIEVAVERYVPATPGAREARHVTKRAAWTGLRTDVERHPQVSALRDLAAAEQELRALRDRPAFARVR